MHLTRLKLSLLDGKMAQWQWWQSKHKMVSSVKMKKKFYLGLRHVSSPLGA